MLKDVNYPDLAKFSSQQLKDKARSVLQKMVKDGHPMEQMGGWIHAGISGSAFTLDPRSPERHRELINDFCNKRQQFIAQYYNASSPANQPSNVQSNLMATQAKDRVIISQLREIHELKSPAQILVPQTSSIPSVSGRSPKQNCVTDSGLRGLHALSFPNILADNQRKTLTGQFYNLFVEHVAETKSMDAVKPIA
ncbi:hypothetical protein MIR68_000468 [Amoeboaphelidium protococcarum]|nr:hypothetical protein MIR68_000468 [Amoeboaphelidium protococcarum]KAI3655092.1 hypothetical protein MP228_000472 [Amoeboaphelidium protococcarum]